MVTETPGLVILAGVKGIGLPLLLKIRGRAEMPNVGSSPTARTNTKTER